MQYQEQRTGVSCHIDAATEAPPDPDRMILLPISMYSEPLLIPPPVPALNSERVSCSEDNLNYCSANVTSEGQEPPFPLLPTSPQARAVLNQPNVPPMPLQPQFLTPVMVGMAEYSATRSFTRLVGLRIENDSADTAANAGIGYDRERFVSEIPNDLICSICLGVMNNPVETVCSHVFCRKCLKQALQRRLRCPVDRRPLTMSHVRPLPRIVHNILGALMLRCRFPQCDEVVTLEEINKHEAVCDRKTEGPAINEQLAIGKRPTNRDVPKALFM